MSRYGGGMDSGRGHVSARVPMSFRTSRSTARSSARYAHASPTGRTGRSIASGMLSAGGSTTRSERERLDELAARYAQGSIDRPRRRGSCLQSVADTHCAPRYAAETARRQRMETRVVELEAELKRLHSTVAPDQQRPDHLA